MIFYAGDIHGRVKYVAEIDQAAAAAGVETVIQVGDFGARWGTRETELASGLVGKGDDPILKYFEKRERQGRPGPTWYTCGGNHENWHNWIKLSEQQGSPDCVELAPGCFYVQRGTTLELDGKKHLFFGGAESTDKYHRTEGKDWFPEESPSAEEFQKFFDAMEADCPEIVVTHDAPICVEIYRQGRESVPTPRNLDNVLKHCDHTPTHWYFGHHHLLQSWNINGLDFHCCGLHGQWVESK